MVGASTTASTVDARPSRSAPIPTRRSPSPGARRIRRDNSLPRASTPARSARLRRESYARRPRRRRARSAWAASTGLLRGSRPRVVCRQARRLGTQLLRQDHCPPGDGRVPVDRSSCRRQRHPAAIARGAAAHRGARRGRDRTPRVARLQPSVSLRSGHRQGGEQSRARPQGCAQATEHETLPRDHRAQALRRTASRLRQLRRDASRSRSAKAGADAAATAGRTALRRVVRDRPRCGDVDSARAAHEARTAREAAWRPAPGAVAQAGRCGAARVAHLDWLGRRLSSAASGITTAR